MYLLPQVEFATVGVGGVVDVTGALVVVALHATSPHIVTAHTRAKIQGSVADIQRSSAEMQGSSAVMKGFFAVT